MIKFQTKTFARSLAWLAMASTAAFASQNVIPENATLQEVFSEGVFTEGVAQAPDGRIVFVDQPWTNKAGAQLGRTLIYDPQSKIVETLISPNGQVTGNKFDRDGNLLMVSRAMFGTRSLIKRDMKTGKATLMAARYEGRPFNSMNDLAIAPDGTVFFTDPRFLGDEPRSQPVYGVYAVDKDLNVTLTLGNVQKPNGVAVSPDGKTLYVAEHYINNDNLFTYDESEDLIYGPMRVLAYDLDGSKVTSKPRVVVNYDSHDGPDGMVTDTHGNLYVASRAEGHIGIEIFSPKGELIDFVPTPVKPTNVALGHGEFRNKLYITAGGSLFVIDTLSEGW